MRTRTDICESMLGIHPVSSKMIIRKILFLHKRLSLPSDSFSQQIFLRKLKLYLTNIPMITRGFVADSCQLLCVYDLQHILQGYTSVQRLPNKTGTISGTLKIYVIVAPEAIQ